MKWQQAGFLVFRGLYLAGKYDTCIKRVKCANVGHVLVD